MTLSWHQKKELFEQGFVKIPGAIPPFLVDRARKAIHHSLGEEGMNKEDMNRFRGRSYCPEIQASPAITDLYNATPLNPLAESAFGTGQLAPVGAGQIALRFPTLADPHGEPSPHIDGADYSKRHANDRVPPIGTLSTFSMLAVVLLGDVPEPWSGNFTVWPGTHRILETYFREHGIEEVAQPGNVGNIIPKLEWPEPHQTTGKAGDAILTHYQIAHGVAPNVSPNIRYAAIFRLRHQEHEKHRSEVTGNIWMEWEGLREVIAASTSE